MAVKFDDGKPKMSLIPPRAKWEVAKAMGVGLEKYGAENYLNGGGFAWRRLVDAAERHIDRWKMNEDIDESGVHHIAHAAAGLMMLLESILANKGTDDRWKDSAASEDRGPSDYLKSSSDNSAPT